MTLNETDISQQTIGRMNITAKQQPTNHSNFHVLTTNHITTKLTSLNHDQRHKYHQSSEDDFSLGSEDDYCLGSRNVSHQQQSF